MERRKNRNATRRSRGTHDLYSEESDENLSRTGPVQDPNRMSRKRPSRLLAKGSSRTEQEITTRSIPHSHDSHAMDDHSNVSANRLNRGNNPTTVHGQPRQRAPAKSHMRARDISRSWDTATPEDKMLMKMKEKGCDWLEIRKAYVRIFLRY